MDETKALLNIGELSKPATVLIEKISEAVGGIFKPYQIKRIARANAEAAKIEAQADIEINQLQQRALLRFLNEETRKQLNIEEITEKAIPKLEKDAKPEEIEEDWLVNFFEKCRNISNKEMQELWSKILANEANQPGSFSKRTIDFVSVLAKNEAETFTRLCSFCWNIDIFYPMIFNIEDEIFKKNNLYFNDLKDLESIGLISFESSRNYQRIGIPKKTRIYYYGIPVDLEFDKEDDNTLEIGQVILSKLGQELFPISNSKHNDEYFEYALKKFFKKGIKLSSPWHNKRVNPSA